MIILRVKCVFRFRPVCHVTWRPRFIATAPRHTKPLVLLYLIPQLNSTPHFSMVIQQYNMITDNSDSKKLSEVIVITIKFLMFRVYFAISARITFDELFR